MAAYYFGSFVPIIMGTSPSNMPGTLGHPVSLVPVVPRADLSKSVLVQYEWPVWSIRSRRYQLLISSVFGIHLPGLW
jgi:hypothetical protein